MKTVSMTEEGYEESFGGIVRMFRKFSLREPLRTFAKRVKKSFGHWGAIERGEVEPSRELVELVAQILDLDRDSLLGTAGMVRRELGVAILRFPRAAVTFMQLLLVLPRQSAERLDLTVQAARMKFVIGSDEKISPESARALCSVFSDAIKHAGRKGGVVDD